MSISKTQFQEEFDEFSVQIPDDDIIYDKLREICTANSFEASEVVTEWLAYSHTKGQCALTAANLDALDRQLQLKKTNKQMKKPANKQNLSSLVDMLDAGDDEDDVLCSYSTPTGKAVGTQKRQRTPDQISMKKKLGRSPVVPFSPASISPARSTPSQKYKSRTHPGEVVCTFGSTAGASWRSKRNEAPVIKQYNPITALTKHYRYMFHKVSDQAGALNEQIEDISEMLRKKHNIEEFHSVNQPSQATVPVAGRISCDSVGKLNAQSVMIEDLVGGSCDPVKLDLSNTPEYALFPGQIVAMEGINPNGMSLSVNSVHKGATLPSDKVPTLKSGLRVLIACGPFTTIDNLSYEPLTDLMAVLHRDAPDVCILLGPFLDIKHPLVEKGDMDVSYKDFFSEWIRNLNNNLRSLKSNTHVIVVPAQRDAHHHPVYPQPPFGVHNVDERLHFVSDPCMLNIDGVVFGITSTDVLFHMGFEEISHPRTGADRLARLAQHLLTQQSFYPLYPSSPDINVDYDHWDVYAKMETKPHVLVVPSDLRYFVKDILGTCCVNPGRLTKAQVGGTYCRMIINSDTSRTDSVVESTVAEILRI